MRKKKSTFSFLFSPCMPPGEGGSRAAALQSTCRN